jgi:mannose-6-phosphate isomerase-like protein (cupin superfamily)
MESSHLQRQLDDALADSFPASDPVSIVTSQNEEYWNMKGFVTDIERDTLQNEDYRRVLFTGRNTQLVLMTLRPGDEIGLETHEEHDQFIRVEAGNGTLLLGGVKHELSDGSAVVIPAGVEHNVINTSRNEPLRLYTLYSPPEHPDGTVHRTKEDDHGH